MRDKQVPGYVIPERQRLFPDLCLKFELKILRTDETENYYVDSLLILLRKPLIKISIFGTKL